MMKMAKWLHGLVASSVFCWSATAGLVGHWNFSEGVGTVVHDSSGQGNDGTLINPQPDTWTNGINGGGVYFSGTTGAGATYVSIPDAPSLSLTSAISFAAWIRCDDINRDAPILDKEGEGKLSYWFGTFGVGQAGNFGTLFSVDGIQPWTMQDRNQGVVSQGLWEHVASTWDGTTIRHYLNGVLLPQTTPFAGPIHVSDAALIIGANVPYNNTAFKGIIADARLYDQALSLSEIQALVGTTPQLVGHWSFDEGSGTNIADSSGFGNNGVLINPKTNTWTAGKAGGALYFPGVVGDGATYVKIPDASSLRIAAQISFAAWVRCDDITRDAPILAKEGDGKLSYWFGAEGTSTTGNFGVLLSSNGNQPWTTYDRNQGSIPQGKWIHLASTWDGTTIRHYVDGELLPETALFAGPIHYSDAFLAIGVNSLYNFAANHAAFQGAIDDVYLYNYALSMSEIQALYLASVFKIRSIALEAQNVRLTWECLGGHRYVVQTNATGLSGGITSVFGDLSQPLVIPAEFGGGITNWQHVGGATNARSLFYRLKMLP